MIERKGKASQGTVVVLVAVMMLTLMGVAGMVVDLGRAYLVRLRLGEALDAALLASARVPPDSRNAVSQQVFEANFPDGWLGTTSRSYAVSNAGGNTTLTGAATLPTYFMQLFGYGDLPIGALAELNQSPGPQVLVLDEDSINTGLPEIQNISVNPPSCGAGNPAVCINDDIAALYRRDLLFTRGNNITPYNGVVIRSGQVGDEGFFRFSRPDPQQPPERRPIHGAAVQDSLVCRR